MNSYDYVTVGHVTRDVIGERSGGTRSQPGGSAFYSALQASRLGLRTLVLTQGVPREIQALLEPYREELDLHVLPAEHTTTLSTRGTGTSRVQRVLAWAGPMTESMGGPMTESMGGPMGGPVELGGAILHLAPVARETPAAWSGDADFVGITPQGLIRRWAPDGEISHLPLDPAVLPPRFDAAVIGESEREQCASLLSLGRMHSAPVAVTAGSRPTTVHLSDGTRVETTPPLVKHPRDDLGAGDVFAAAFFIALREGQAPQQAAAFGNAAAAVRVGGVGAAAIGRHSQIETLLRGG